jgi:hypothetical protein
MNRGFFYLFLLGIALTSCERTVNTALDADYSQPYLHTLEVFPVSFNTDTILVNGGTDPDDIINLSLTCSIVADVPVPGQSIGVTWSVTRPGGGPVSSGGTLLDNGIFPDDIAGDGKYSGVITFSIRRVEVGLFEVSVVGAISDIVSSNRVIRTVPVFRSSRAPFLTNLSAPDTVTLPPANQVLLILMSVAASDSDGPEDVREVYFRNLDSPSDTTKKFFMYDDGDLNGLSGDSVANDGYYSIIVQLPSGTPPATYRFSFEAQDRLDLLSTPLVHPLTVLGPE